MFREDSLLLSLEKIKLLFIIGFLGFESKVESEKVLEAIFLWSESKSVASISIDAME